MKFLNLIKKIEKGKTFLLMLVVGSGFLLFTLLPLFFNDWQVEGSMWGSFLFGAAGLAMGNGWLFPGTYSRMDAFRRGVKRGLKIVVGTVPVFIVAGFIESFATRHVDMGDAWRLGIIAFSALFIVYYFIVLPYLKHHESGKTTN